MTRQFHNAVVLLEVAPGNLIANATAIYCSCTLPDAAQAGTMDVCDLQRVRFSSGLQAPA